MLHRYLAVQTVKWRLHARVACSLAVFVFAALVAGVACLALHVRSLQTEAHEENVLWFHWSVPVMKLISVFLCASAASAYIYASHNVPRPVQLHANGLALLIMLVELVTSAWVVWLYREKNFSVAWSVISSFFFFGGVRKAIFYTVATGKMSVLGSRAPRCLRIKFLGAGLIVSTLAWTFVVGLGFGMIAGLHLTGHSPDDGNFFEMSTASATGILTWVVALVFALGVLAVPTMALGFALSAWNQTKRVVKKLVERDAASEKLRGVRSTLWQHFAGVLVSVLTNSLLIVSLFAASTFGLDEDRNRFAIMAAQFVDEIGDIVGILLLSGLGVLLFSRDTDAGDVSSRISGLLHSAVLTSRAQTVFEGHVAKTRGNFCVASFPGKYWEGWSSLTWKCEQGEVSSACVFLPELDPKQRFGKHTENSETPRSCWCTSLYGDVRPWGCQWFVEWKSNIEKAAGLGLDLVVVYFPGQTGLGKVAWGDLPIADLWNGEGLGGSQKAEVAYLQRQELPFLEVDVDTFLSWEY